MLQSGVAPAAWSIEDAERIGEAWINALERDKASQLIAEGVEAQRVLGHRALADLPAQIGSDLFDLAAFERGVAERQRRLRGAAVSSSGI